MPLPLIIPVAIGAASVIAGGGISLKAQANIKKAKAEHAAAHEAYKIKHDSFLQYYQGTLHLLREVGKARVTGMQALHNADPFINLAKLIDPNVINDQAPTIPELEKMEQTYDDIIKTLGGATASITGGAAAGLLAAFGAYGLTGTLGSASTGAAISGLGGAAATSATWAWFGGGAAAAGGLGMAGGAAVLGGIVAMPIPIAFGVFYQVKAGKVKKEAAQKIKEIQEAEGKIKEERAKLSDIRKRSDDVKLAVIQQSERLTEVLSGAFPDNTEDVRVIVQIAAELRAAINEPVIKPAGRCTSLTQWIVVAADLPEREQWFVDPNILPAIAEFATSVLDGNDAVGAGQWPNFPLHLWPANHQVQLANLAVSQWQYLADHGPNQDAVLLSWHDGELATIGNSSILD